MDWQTLLTAFAGALGGTVTALIVVGFFGKTIIEHWFSKSLKRYEADLNEAASRNKARFDYAHPERAKFASEIYGKCTEMRRSFNYLVVSYTLKAHGDSEDFSRELRHQCTELLGELVELNHELERRVPLLGSEFAGKVQAFTQLLAKAVAIDLKSITAIKDLATDVFEQNEIITKTQMDLLTLQNQVEKAVVELLGMETV